MSLSINTGQTGKRVCAIDAGFWADYRPMGPPFKGKRGVIQEPEGDFCESRKSEGV